MNYYKLFNLPVAPVVQKSAIAKKYFALQKENHPDFFTNEPEAEKENALEQSALINKAFATFSNAEKTLEYFLQINGIIIADEKYNLPADFLMEMMELNEDIDAETAIETKITAYSNELYSEVEALLSIENSETLTENDFQKLKSYFYKKKYLKRILERLDD